MAERTGDTEQFPWPQHAPLTYRRFQLRNNFFIRNKKSGPNPVPYLEFLLYIYFPLPVLARLWYAPAATCTVFKFTANLTETMTKCVHIQLQGKIQKSFQQSRNMM